MKKTLVLVSIVFLLGAMVSPVYGQLDLDWVGGTIPTGGSWHTNTNWEDATGNPPASEPTAADTVYIFDDGLALITGTAQARRLIMGCDSAYVYGSNLPGTPGYIKQTDGTLTLGSAGVSEEVLKIGYAAKATYDHLGGTLNILGERSSYDANFWIGGSGYWHSPGPEDDVSATYNISGDAVLNILGSDESPGGLNIGYWQLGDMGTSLVNQTGGTVNVKGKIVVGDDGPGEGRYKISAGSMSCGSMRVSRYGGPGVLQVVGSDASISVGSYHQDPSGTLQCDVGNPGISVVGVTDTATFASGSTLDMGRVPGVVVEKDEQFTLLTATSIVDNGLTLAAEDADYWDFEIVGNSLVVTRLVYPGDLNCSDYVDGDDLDILLADWGKSVPPADPRADVNGESNVNGDDLDYILADWAKGTPPPVPEPITLSLLAIGGLALIRRKK